MTLEILKQKATAAELALIEKVETLVRESVEERSTAKVSKAFNDALEYVGHPLDGTLESKHQWWNRVAARTNENLNAP